MDLFLRIRQDEAPSGLETGGGAFAGGDDDDGGVDRRASGDGHARLSEPSLISPEEAERGVVQRQLFFPTREK